MNTQQIMDRSPNKKSQKKYKKEARLLEILKSLEAENKRIEKFLSKKPYKKI